MTLDLMLICFCTDVLICRDMLVVSALKQHRRMAFAGQALCSTDLGSQYAGTLSQTTGLIWFRIDESPDVTLLPSIS